MDRVILSRRNLLTLLSKLDRHKAGEATARTLVKADQDVAVTAIEDEEYYVDRTPGAVHPSDDPSWKWRKV